MRENSKTSNSIILLSSALLSLAGCGAERSLDDDPNSGDNTGLRQTSSESIRNHKLNYDILFESQRTAQKHLDQPFVPFQSFAGTIEASPSQRLSQLFSGTFERSYIDGRLAKQLTGLGSAWRVETKEELIEFIGKEFHWKELTSNETVDGTVTSRSQLVFNGIPVASASVIEQQDITNSRWIGAAVPGWITSSISRGSLPFIKTTPFSYSADEAKEKYHELTGFDLQYIIGGEPYYVASATGLRAAYRYTITSESEGEQNLSAGRVPSFPHVPLITFVDADNASILEQYPLAFHLNGAARIYRENRVASAQEGLTNLVLPDLLDDGSRLSNAIFDVKNCRQSVVGEKCDFAAKPADGANYTAITPESENYDELVAYHGVSRAMTWYRQLMGPTNGSYPLENSWKDRRSNFGLSSSSTNKLTVYVRALSKTPQGGNTTDNAVYLPGGTTGTGSPEILIGTGWEESMGIPTRSLRYIGKDSDVSMHEFGHHIVFRSISEIKGQGLAMHEGFADYFTYSITGNNFLAESVVSYGAALRSGNKNGTLADYPPATTPPHSAGEFWSTVLWDIRTTLGAWKDGFSKFDAIVYHAIDLMQPSETYYGAIAAISKAATTFAREAGEDPVLLKEKIYAHFYKRGFIETPNGTGELPAPSALLTGSSTATELSGASQKPATGADSAKPKKASLIGLSCTVGGALADQEQKVDLGTLLILLILVSIPLYPSTRRKFTVGSLSVVRVKSKQYRK